jgi:hypothetical protein
MEWKSTIIEVDLEWDWDPKSHVVAWKLMWGPKIA